MDLPSLDVTYFTSLSYYILLLFGLRGVFMLFFRDEVVDETQMMRQQMAGGGNPMGGAPDPQKAMEAEKAAFDLVRDTKRSPISCLCQVHIHMKYISVVAVREGQVPFELRKVDRVKLMTECR